MRKIEKIYKTQPTIEGAGVKLKRGFSYREAEKFDPFLLFDDFSNIEESDYVQGFPTHPHRGIETVTYILKGEVAHKDSLGNQGVIVENQVQWMTAGSGIVHEEMPQIHKGGIQGFQLWVNLPMKYKMTSPRYQDIDSQDIPVVEREGRAVKVIAGTYEDHTGPVTNLMVSPTYLDVALNPETSFELKTENDDTFFVYVFEGRVMIRDDRSELWIGEGEIGLLTNDSLFACVSGKINSRFLIIGGKPLNESIAWHGPIVMNTQEEIETALAELKNGRFIKSDKK